MTPREFLAAKLAALRESAATYGEARAIVAVYYATRGTVTRTNSLTQAHSWECLSCGEVTHTRTNPPKRECPCGARRWSEIRRKEEDPTETPDREVDPQDFFFDFSAWVNGRFGAGAVDLVLCEFAPPQDRAACGDCKRCPRAVRDALGQRVREVYEESP